MQISTNFLLTIKTDWNLFLKDKYPENLLTQNSITS